ICQLKPFLSRRIVFVLKLFLRGCFVRVSLATQIRMFWMVSTDASLALRESKSPLLDIDELERMAEFTDFPRLKDACLSRARGLSDAAASADRPSGPTKVTCGS